MGDYSSHRAIPAVAAAKVFHRIKKVLLCKIRPEFRGDVHLCVGKLPEKEIRKAHLAGGADEQIRIGVIARVEMLAKHVYVDHRPIDVAGIDLAQQAFYAVDDLKTASVTKM